MDLYKIYNIYNNIYNINNIYKLSFPFVPDVLVAPLRPWGKAVDILSGMNVKKNTDKLYEAKLLQKLAWLHLFEQNFVEAEQATRVGISMQSKQSKPRGKRENTLFNTHRVQYQYCIHLIAFLYVLVPASPTYGVSGWPQVVLFVEIQHAFLQKGQFLANNLFSLIFDDCAHF